AFFTVVNVTNLFLEAAVVGILAIGTTTVIITEEIDLSIGAIEGLSAVMAGLVIVYHQVWWPLGIAAALGTGIIVGWVNGVVTTKLGVPSFIVTLAMRGLCTGLALQSTNGQSI